MKQILIVEDSERVADALKALLEDSALIIHVDSVVEALGTDWRDVELMIVDWKLGEETARPILTLASLYYPEIPIIIFTGYSESAGKLRREGYLVFEKPDFETLIEMLQKLIDITI